MDKLSELQRRYSGEVSLNEPMSRYTNYRLGGPADAFIVANTADELAKAAMLATELEIPWLVIGNGTNILVADAGVRGLVLQNHARRFELRDVPQDNDHRHIDGESGVLIAELSRFTIERGLSGLQYAIGIPGTLGGGVVSNAAAHGGSLHKVLRSAKVLCDGSSVREFSMKELGLGYRSSIFKDRARPKDIILSVELELEVGDGAAIKAEADEILARRAERLPTEPSAGSTFVNPPGRLVAELIEKAGLKGRRVGGAEVSPKHANFLVNTGTATAQDVRDLVEVVREEVRQRFGVELSLEMEMIGEWSK